MKEYIEREAAIDNFMQYTWYDKDGITIDDSDEKRNILEDMFASIPTADVRENVRGKWVLKTAPHPCGESCWRECSNCGEEPLRNRWNRSEYLSDFCPNCEAQMEEETK